MRFFACGFVGVLVLAGAGFGEVEGVELQIIAKPGDVIDGKQIGEILAFQMNNSDEVVFFTSFNTEQNGFGRGIFTQSRLVVSEGDVIDGHEFFWFGNYVGADINAAGEVAFCGYFESTLGPPSIATLERIVASKGDVVDGKVLTGQYQARINDSGEVSYFGYFDDNRGIFTEDRLVVAVGDTVDGKILSGVNGDFEVNNAGEIAFIAYFENGGGIFTQDRLIAQIGDIVDGKIISYFSSPEINDRGHVAFLATFDDGTRGIVLAVPEPCVMAQLLFGGLVLAVAVVVRRNVRFDG